MDELLFSGSWWNTGQQAIYNSQYANQSPASARPTADKMNWGAAGAILGIASVLQGAVGSFYQAKNEQYQLKSQESSMRFQQTMANINARAAEQQAQAILEAGEQQIGQYTMQAGQQKAAAQASLAARGVQAGVGSAAETMATADIVKEIDVITINANTVRAAEAQRMQRVNILNEGAMAGVSASNLRAMRRSINPYVGASASLLGSAGRVASMYAVSQNRGYYPSDY